MPGARQIQTQQGVNPLGQTQRLQVEQRRSQARFGQGKEYSLPGQLTALGDQLSFSLTAEEMFKLSAKRLATGKAGGRLSLIW